MSELALKLIAENKAKYARGEDARVLDLGNCGLTEIPEEVGELVWLEELSFHYSPFIKNGVYPESIGRNNIKKLCSSFKNLINLIKLDISGDTSLNNDHSFDLSDISDLSYLANLRHLSICDTNVYDLSPLSKLQNLEYLELSYTGVYDLSPISNLKHIKYIGLYYTNVKDLSPIISMIKNGLKVNHANPSLIHPPPAIVEQGNAAIINYFAERSKQQFKNTEIKLIFLGNSTAGKTTLSRYLREQTYNPNQPTTHGIQNHRWQSPGGREMDVSIWDFGGQEYYHATHRLFLSRNAVYTLVWDGKTDKGGTEPTEIHYENDPQAYQVPLEHFSKAWWLKNIHFNLNKYARHEREGDAPIPVLLVQNKCAAGADYDMQDVPNEFGNAPFHLPAIWRNNHIDLAEAATEQTNGEQGQWTMRFKLLEQELLKTLESQIATYEFAVYHRDIRDRVRALASGENPTNEMSWADFEAMCREIEPDAKMDLVQIYLRDITGDILYFDQNERLRHRVFLRSDWVCNRLYAILSRKVLEREGLFDLSWVQEALQCDELEALDFIELMHEFQLVFAENDEKNEPTGNFFAPQYLPAVCTKPDKLEAAKEYANLTYAFTLWFPEFLPKSHFVRFIARWGSSAEKRLFWKNGLLFKINGCTAFVEHSSGDKIWVEIQSGNQNQRISAIQRVFQSFVQLEDGEPGFAISVDNQTFVRWSDVQKQMRLGASKGEVFFPKNAEPVSLEPFKIFEQPISSMKKIFISYSKSDKDYLETVKKHLKLFERQSKLRVWDDTQLIPGEQWDEAIKRELETADIILFLVSADLLATDYIWEVEMTTALARADKGEVIVVPVIIRDCAWTDAPFGKFNALPAKGTPIATAPNADAAWKEVVERIGKIC